MGTTPSKNETLAEKINRIAKDNEGRVARENAEKLEYEKKLLDAEKKLLDAQVKERIDQFYKMINKNLISNALKGEKGFSYQWFGDDYYSTAIYLVRNADAFESFRSKFKEQGIDVSIERHPSINPYALPRAINFTVSSHVSSPTEKTAVYPPSFDPKEPPPVYPLLSSKIRN